MLRAVSLGLALLLSVIGSTVPFVLARHPTGLNQTLLLVMMLGVTGGFVHGVGIRVENKWAQRLTAPVLTWPLMLGCFGAMLMLRSGG
jgi:predicted membrane protein